MLNSSLILDKRYCGKNSIAEIAGVTKPIIMKKLFALSLLAFLAIACQAPEQQNTTDNSTTLASEPVMENVLRHVVLFKFKDESSAEDVQGVVDAFMALPSKIDGIQAIEYGTNNSPEGLAQGFTHCFLLSFASEKDRDDYLPHPDHKAFGEVLRPHLDQVLVVDYWAKK